MRTRPVLRPLFGTLLATCAIAITSPAAGAATLGVCCAWNDQLADGRLTYSVEGGTADARAAAADAVEDWDAQLSGVQLDPVTGRGANIPIRFKKGGGTTAGATKRSFDRAFFVKAASITIASSSFGLSNELDDLHFVTLHEVGHALGLNHADEDGWLMSPVVQPGFPGITACEVDGVREANHWYLVDGAAAPHHPHVTSITC